MSRPLADPDWPAMLPNCPGCGYSLNGLMPPTQCPECGFEVDNKTLILRGVVKSDASQSAVRKVLWGFAIVVGVILLYGWVLLIHLGLFGLLLFLTWLAGFIALITTSKRDRAGHVAIVFAAGGFKAVADLTDPRHEGTAVRWDRVQGIKLERVSNVWYRLRLWSRTDSLLDAGVRCPIEHAALVFDTLESFRTGQEPSVQSNSTASTQIGPSGVS